MADILIDTQSVPSNPTPGQVVIYADTTSKDLVVRDSSGFNRGFISNFSTAVQTPGAASLTYITGSNLAIPTGKMQIGTCFRWTFDLTKTAAGTAASTYAIVVGTLGTTGDTARVSFTKPAGTAAIDTALITVTAICRGPLSAAGIFTGNFQLVKNALEPAGHCATPSVNLTTVSSGFDVTLANLIVGLVVTSGAADALTIQQVTSEAWNL